jgi:hypothetical protein
MTRHGVKHPLFIRLWTLTIHRRAILNLIMLADGQHKTAVLYSLMVDGRL